MQDKNIQSAFEIKCDLSTDFFYCWLSFINPLWKATPGMIRLATEFLKHRFALKADIKNDEILDKHLLEDKKIKRQIMEACEMTYGSFNVTLGFLRKSKFFVDGKINPKFIPKLPDSPSKMKEYNLLITFVFDGHK